MKNLILILAITLFSLSLKSQNLHGTASNSGLYGAGTIYSYDVTTATKSDVFDFPNEAIIDLFSTSLCESNGKLYGVSSGLTGKFRDRNGNAQGVLFEYNQTTNTHTVLHHFGDAITGEPGVNGGKPIGSLISLNGKLYGVTALSGTNNYGFSNYISSGFGVLFEFDPITNVYTKLKDFAIGYGNPNSPLVLASDGNFYGVTVGNGAGVTPMNGVVYKYDLASNSLSVVSAFPSGASNPLSKCNNIKQAANGKLYGIAEGLVSGITNNVIFECDIVSNSITQKASFGALTFLNQTNAVLYDGQNGNFYGSNFGPGGSIFEYNIASDSITTKYSFTTTSGYPYIGAGINPSVGKFYGHTITSTANPYGEIFEFNYNTNTYSIPISYSTSGSFYGVGDIFFASNNKAYSYCTYKPGLIASSNIQEIDFSTNTSTYKISGTIAFGENPTGNLLKASDGKLYGTTSRGSESGKGCLFSFDPVTQVMTKIKNFTQNNGIVPNENMVEVGGKIYGTTKEGGMGFTGGTSGVLFEYTIATNSYIVKKTFTNLPATGYRPIYGLIVGSNGKLYGQTETSTSGGNAIFEYDISSNTIIWVFNFPSGVGSYNGALSEGASGIFYTYNGSGLSKIDINTNTQTQVTNFGTTVATNGTGKPLIINNSIYCLLGSCVARYDILTNTTTPVVCNGFISGPIMPAGGIIKANNDKLYYNTTTYSGFSNGGITGPGQLAQVFELDPVTLSITLMCTLEATGGHYPKAALIDTSSTNLSINSNLFLNNFKVYPNPSNGNFNIEIDHNLIGSNVSIHNLLGQKIKDFNLNSTITNLNLNKGIYIIEVTNEGSKKTQKLIVN